MNIFPLHTDPYLAASYALDTHVRKIPIEIAQMLASSLNASERYDAPRTSRGSIRAAPSRIKNHPVTKWIFADEVNMAWTLEYFRLLLREQVDRNFKLDQNSLNFGWWFVYNKPTNLTQPTPTTWPCAIKESSLCCQLPLWPMLNPIERYRAYYMLDKRVDKNGKSMLKWKGKAMPVWFIDSDKLNDIMANYKQWRFDLVS